MIYAHPWLNLAVLAAGVAIFVPALAGWLDRRSAR